MAKIIVGDPGHDGSQPGAVANGLKEKDIALDIAKRFKAYLEKNYDVKVLLTRSNDNKTSLQYRTDFANRNNAAAFVSFHVNAGGGTGFESYVVAGASPNSAGKLQRLLHEEMSPVLNKLGLRDRGKKYDNQSQHSRLHVLRATKMKAVLSENLFIDTKKDASLLKSASFRQEVAEAHARAVARCEGLKKKVSAPKPAPKPPVWTDEQKKQIARLNPAPKPEGTRFTRTLKYVAGNQIEGDDVLAVQYFLGVKPWKDKNGKVVGTFGSLTRDKLKEWQKKNGIKVTGEVGIVNWRKMFGEKKEDPNPSPAPKPELIRVKVNGKQVGAFAESGNAVSMVKKYAKPGAQIDVKTN